MRYVFRLGALAALVIAPWSVARAQRAGDPGLGLWKGLKAALLAPDGQSYFDMAMKGAQLPTLKGKVVRLEPNTNPTTILLAVEDGVTADATLRFHRPLEGTVDVGKQLSFEGVAESFTRTPFMIVFDVEDDHLHGWPRSH